MQPGSANRGCSSVFWKISRSRGTLENTSPSVSGSRAARTTWRSLRSSSDAHLRANPWCLTASSTTLLLLRSSPEANSSMHLLFLPLPAQLPHRYATPATDLRACKRCYLLLQSPQLDRCGESPRRSVVQNHCLSQQRARPLHLFGAHLMRPPARSHPSSPPQAQAVDHPQNASTHTAERDHFSEQPGERSPDHCVAAATHVPAPNRSASQLRAPLPDRHGPPATRIPGRHRLECCSLQPPAQLLGRLEAWVTRV
mmetsp:Transcript_13367/g.49661  ORF Transcript_13367/g.49661 Transcript_13367/m.49661 type:complete len:255 (+) Transcript_13367:351-1115(+)